ncbi:MAG: lipopolysaccharide biosynthesis protein [Terriglobales bacterium]|jgi:PST family polysaccharide transporter
MTISKVKTFRNIIYASFTKGITLFCVALTSLVVARNLTPADYGVVGFAGIIIGFLSRFSDMGVGSAVIRRPVLHHHSLQTAFTLKIILSSGAFVVALSIAPFARHLFDHPATGNVIRILALNFLVSTIGFLPLVMLTREMNYRALVIPGVASAAVQCILAVTLVLHGWSYWAVIIANVGATLAGGIVIQLTKRIPIRFRFDRADVREYLRFGAPLLGTGVLVFALFNLDNLLVGASMGSAQLGYYALAFTWGSFICGLLGDTVHNVLFPAFSAIQHDSVAVRRWYLKTVDLVAFSAVVANTALLANAPFFLVTFLGKGTDKWLPATSAFQILCVYGIVRAITEPLGNCVLARGKTKTLLHANVLAGTVELVLLLLALRSRRIEVVAAAVLVAYASQVVVYLPFLRREFSIGIGDIVAKIWPIIPALLVGWLITSLLPRSFGSTFFTLTIRGLFTASVVALTHGLFSRFRCFHEAGGMISQNFARVGA